MANMFDPTEVELAEAEVTPPGSPYGGQRFGGQKFGGQTYGGQTHGGQTHGGLRTGRSAQQAPSGAGAGEQPPEPPAEAIDTGRSRFGNQRHGGQTYGGQTYGGQTYGGQTFGGNRFGASSEQGPSGAGAGEQPLEPPPDNRSWGERHSLGARPGGNTYGGNTYGGNRFGGQTFGEGSQQAPSGAGAGEQPPPDNRSWGERHSLGARPGGNTFGGNRFGGNRFGGNTFGESSRVAPSGAGAGERGDYVPSDQAVGAAGLNVGDPYPPGSSGGSEIPTHPMHIPPRQGEYGPGRDGEVTPPGNRPGATAGRGGGGGGGGGGGAGGRRKALGDQSRREAYDPTADRADPRNVAPIDEKGRANPKLWERAQKGAIDPTKPGERTGEQAAKYTNNYTNSLAGATEYMREMFHQKPGDPNQGEGYAALTFKGMGAPDPKIVDGVFKVVDPNNELQPKEKMELATRAMHDWYTAKGDKKSADKVAAEILQHGNTQAKALGNQAMQAYKAGNREAAVQAITQAYSWLPDGFDAAVQNNTLTITNDQGKTVRTLPLDDKMIANLSTGMATGTLFWDIVQERAGVQDKFGPPKQAPTQAIAAQPPPPGTPPAATAPGGASSPPLSAPPGSPPPVPAPGPPAPVPVTPPSNRPVAPASAAPGPAPTSQAAAPAPAPTQAVTPAPPPGLTHTPAPTSTIASAPAKPPAVSTPPQGSGGPPGSPAGQPSAKTEPAETKPAETKPAETKPVETKPVETKPVEAKPARDEGPYRRRTVNVTPEVRRAVEEIQELDKQYDLDRDWIFQEAGKSKSSQYTKKHAALKETIDKKYQADRKRAEDVIKTFRAEQKKADEGEQAELKPERYKGSEAASKVTAINERMKGYVDQGDKWKLARTNPLRMENFNDEKKWGPVRDVVLEVKAHNKHLSDDKVTDAVLTAMSHLMSDEEGKKEALNGKTGREGARFKELKRDLNSNMVIEIGKGEHKIHLHMPPETLNEIKVLKNKSYDYEKKQLDEAKGKQTNRERLVKDVLDVLPKGDQTPKKQEDKSNVEKLGDATRKWFVGDKLPENP